MILNGPLVTLLNTSNFETGVQMTNSVHSLVADVGGTNTRVALAVGRQVIDETIRRYENKDHGSLQDILSGYLRLS